MEQRREEQEYLQQMLEMEDLAKKKANVYARLLIEPSLAKKMEELALRHEERKTSLQQLIYGKGEKK